MAQEILTLHRLFLYASGRLDKREAANLEQQIKFSKTAREDLQAVRRLLLTLESKGAGTKPQKTPKKPNDQIFFDLQEKYFQGTLSEKELNKFCEFLAGSSRLFAAFAASLKVRSLGQPADLMEEQILAEVAKTGPLNPSTNPQREPGAGLARTVLSRLRSRRAAAGRYGTVVYGAGIALALVLSFLVYDSLQDRQIRAAADAEYTSFVRHLRVGDGDLRPAGVAEFALIKLTRAEMDLDDVAAETPNLLKACERWPRNPRFQHRMAVVFLHQGDLARAEQYFERALALAGRGAHLLSDYALLAVERGDFETATARLDEAIAADPDCQEAHYNLAMIRQKSGDLRAAKAAWKRYLEVDRNLDSDWNRAAASYLQKLEEE